MTIPDQTDTVLLDEYDTGVSTIRTPSGIPKLGWVSQQRGETYSFATEKSTGQDTTRESRSFQQVDIPEVKERFRINQKWEGSVIEVSDDAFLARLETIVGEDQDIEAEIYLEEVDLPERSLVKPGANFYWSIGYLDRPSGRIRVSKIRFRRYPSWTQGELEAANNEAADLRKLFDAE